MNTNMQEDKQVVATSGESASTVNSGMIKLKELFPKVQF